MRARQTVIAVCAELGLAPLSDRYLTSMARCQLFARSAQ